MNTDPNPPSKSARQKQRPVESGLPPQSSKPQPPTPQPGVKPSADAAAPPAPATPQKEETPVSSLEEQHRFLVELQRREMKEHGYKTNHLVTAEGALNNTERDVTINNKTFRLSKAEFVVFVILASHGRSLRGLSSPRRIVGGKFLTAEEILRAIDAWGREDSRLAGFWAQATFPTVHRTIWELRRKLEGVSDLIESGPHRDGYRLSASPYNVIINVR